MKAMKAVEVIVCIKKGSAGKDKYNNSGIKWGF